MMLVLKKEKVFGYGLELNWKYENFKKYEKLSFSDFEKKVKQVKKPTKYVKPTATLLSPKRPKDSKNISNFCRKNFFCPTDINKFCNLQLTHEYPHRV